MSSEKDQMIEMAKSLGWHTIQQNPMYPNDPNNLAGFKSGDYSALYGIPDYLHDLNSMHEVEKFLNPDDFTEYLKNLNDATQSESRFEIENRFALIHATASQRAKAFLKTIKSKAKGMKP